MIFGTDMHLAQTGSISQSFLYYSWSVSLGRTIAQAFDFDALPNRSSYNTVEAGFNGLVIFCSHLPNAVQRILLWTKNIPVLFIQGVGLLA
jgi:hypothetical protein